MTALTFNVECLIAVWLMLENYLIGLETKALCFYQLNMNMFLIFSTVYVYQLLFICTEYIDFFHIFFPSFGIWYVAFNCSFGCLFQQLASHGLFDVHVKATGDIHIDDHHTNEDVALAIGTVRTLSQLFHNKLEFQRINLLSIIDLIRKNFSFPVSTSI